MFVLVRCQEDFENPYMLFQIDSNGGLTIQEQHDIEEQEVDLGIDD